MSSLMRRSTKRRASLGTNVRTNACAARSSGWVRSGNSLYEPELLPGGGELVTRVELPAAPRLDLAVHAYPPVRDQRLGLAPGVDHARHLEQLPEADRVAADLDVAHGADGSSGGEQDLDARVLADGLGEARV